MNTVGNVRTRRWEQLAQGVASVAIGMRMATFLASAFVWPAMVNVNSVFAQETPSGEPTAAQSEKSGEEAKANVAETSPTVSATPDLGTTTSGTSTSTSATPAEPAETSFRTVTNLRYLTENRPEWVESLATHVDGEYRVPVKAGPFTNELDCEKSLNQEVGRVTKEYIVDLTDSTIAPMFISYDLSQLRKRGMIHAQFKEQLQTSVGLMNQHHVLIAFDDKFRDVVERRWAELRARDRLLQVGLWSGSGLMFLLTMFGYFRLDTATKGYYSRRLQFGALGTILAVAAACLMAARSIQWL